MRSISVFCGSKPGTNPIFTQTARTLGQRLAEENITLVYGGGSVGLMGAVADGCLEAGGNVTGVITHQLMALEVGHHGCTELIQVETMLERKTVMAEHSDAFLSLPGGIGTLDELFEMLTWSQLDLHPHPKPSALLNIDGYYDHLTTFLENVVNAGFVSREHLSMLSITTSIDEALTTLRDYTPVELDKWNQ